MTGHLGCWVSDLADGQLDAAATERALEHVAGCARCAEDLAAARAAHRALVAARDVTPDPELTNRLLALSASIPSAAGDPLRATSRGWETPSAWTLPLADDLAEGERRRRRRHASLLGIGGAGIVGATLFVLGNAPVVAPDASRTAALDLLAAAPAVSVPADPTGLDQLAASGWAVPTDLPAGYEVTTVRVLATGSADDAGGLRIDAVTLGDGDAGSDVLVEVDLAGPDGTVVVRQAPGRLAVTGHDGLDVPGHDVQVLSTDPWHVAWQAGDTALDLTADVPEDVLADLVAAFPAGRYDAGVLPQLSRGWTTVTGALSRP